VGVTGLGGLWALIQLDLSVLGVKVDLSVIGVRVGV